jgi:hypothetical protein
MVLYTYPKNIYMDASNWADEYIIILLFLMVQFCVFVYKCSYSLLGWIGLLLHNFPADSTL